jgi:hypothetical protein
MLILSIFLIGWVAAFGQNQSRACTLDTAKDGQTITIAGKAVQQPHDLALHIEGCNDLVVLSYAGDQDTDVSVRELRQDENLNAFQKYTTSVYKSEGNNICTHCMKYGDVRATLTGLLQVAAIPPGTTKDQVGFLHDRSGKVVGTSGWGHPNRWFKYRLVILSVAHVKARKLPPP